jgi:hypothetical protein
MNIFKRIVRSALTVIMLTTPLQLFSEPEAGSFLILNNPVNAGFGAVFSSVLSALNLYDQGNYAGIKIDLNSGIYLDSEHGPNWWEYFFEPIDLGDMTKPNYIFSQGDVSLLINNGFVIPRERALELIQKYIRIKPSLQKKINRFTRRKFKDCFIIGIHHRGTDKKLETPIVSYETTLFHLRWWINNLPKKTKVRIFIATDDQYFLDYVKQLYPKQIVYNKFIRSGNGDPIHYNDSLYKGNYQKGEEALLDCLLLSRCDLLLFPAASAFSMMSLKFNPGLRAIPLSGEPPQ